MINNRQPVYRDYEVLDIMWCSLAQAIGVGCYRDLSEKLEGMKDHPIFMDDGGEYV